MTDDKFQLGNFKGVREVDKEDPSLRESPLKADDRGNLNKIAAPLDKLGARNDKSEIIEHPTEKAYPQAKFRYHDGTVIKEIELEKIVPNEFQPRRIFNEEKLKELAVSIEEHGIIQPLVVVARDDGRFEIVVGERRFRAARIAGLRTVPAFISPKIERETKLELALIENIQRADLNPIEEAKAYERLRDEFGLAVSEIARRVGKDDSTISNLLRLLNLPAEIQRALVEEVISEGQARPLLSLRDREEMLQMYEIIVREHMKVRDIENKVREIRSRRIKVKEMFTPDPFLESFQNLLRNKLGTRVEVNRSAKGGKITIEFFSDEELNDIIGKIA